MCNAISTYLQHIKHNMSIIDIILGFLAPYDCLVCAAEGDLLCSVCAGDLPRFSARCYACLSVSEQSRTCADCAPSSALALVHTATSYSGAAKQLIWQLKSGGVQAAGRIMAERLAEMVRDTAGATLVPVPTATGRVRRRGFRSGETACQGAE